MSDYEPIRDRVVSAIASHYAAREREVQELVKVATKAGERIWEHHEIGHISRAFKQGAGSCELCSDGIFREIESALAPFAAKGETGSVAAQGEQHD